MLISTDSVTRVLYVCVCAIFFYHLLILCVCAVVFIAKNSHCKVNRIEFDSVNFNYFNSICLNLDFFFYFLFKNKENFFSKSPIILHLCLSCVCVCMCSRNKLVFSDTSLNFVVFFLLHIHFCE